MNMLSMGFNSIDQQFRRFGVSKEKAGLPETVLFKRLEGGGVEEVARWDLYHPGFESRS